MKSVNRYYQRSKISERKFRQIVRYFAMDFTASNVAQLTGLTLNSTNSNDAIGANDVIDVRVPSTARAKFARGREALAKKNQQDAIPHFEKALTIYPEFLDARLLLATALMDLREWQKAETAFLRALEIKRDDPPRPCSL